ncbi:MAG: replication factor C large subunit [Candidatus Woesearchaeota archaeon]
MDPFFTYKPSLLSEFIGQDDAVDKLASFFSGFSKGLGLLLYGPPGTGKTSMVYAFAKQEGYDILELNASDTRNKAGLKDFLSKATGQASLFGPKKIVLLDEIDGLSGTKDRGAAGEIVKAIKSSPFPIVMTGTNIFDKKFSSLRKVCKKVEFPSLKSSDIRMILDQTCERMDVDCDSDVLRAISRNAAGDARAALNDLFSFVVVKKSSVDTLEVRRQTEVLGDVLVRVLKSTDPNVVFGAFDNVDEDLDKIFLWLDENIPREYRNSADLANAFDILSRADVFFGRIRRWQYYRFYVYCYLLLSVGVALSKEKKYPGVPSYKQPTRLLKYWRANIAFAKRDSIVEKIAQSSFVSKNRARKDCFYFLLPALIRSKELQEELDLTDDEVSWLEKQSV